MEEISHIIENFNNYDYSEKELIGDKLFIPSTIENSPAYISFSNLNVTTKSIYQTKPKVLLNNLTGTIPGGLCAIMGSSGSGKTTFLSALSLRTDEYRMRVSGILHLNGHRYFKYNLKLMSSYVMQDDLFDSHFKVSETLLYMSQLRMSRTNSIEEMKERVTFVMKLMGIYHCRDVIVGDTRNKGISGGERKRLSIAIELLSKPSLLFLDEPTSGLDAGTALSVMETLHGISNKGFCTIICTIHQPQSKIFNLFDNLILMSEGNIIYQGNCSRSIPFFQSLGCNFFESCNPADQIIHFIKSYDYENNINDISNQDDQDEDSYIALTNINQATSNLEMDDISAIEASEFMKSLNTSNVNYKDEDHYNEDTIAKHNLPNKNNLITNDIEANSKSNLLHLMMEGKIKPKANLLLGCTKPDIPKVKKQLWIIQFIILLKRCIHAQLNRYDIIFMNLAVTILIAFFTSSSVWYEIGTHKSSSSKRQAALFFCVIHQGIVASLQGTHSFPLDRALMLRERSAGAYQVSAYFLAKSFGDMILQVISPIIFTCIVYNRIGLQSSTDQFLVFMGIMILDNFAATSLSNMVSCLFVSIEMSTVILAGCYEVSRLYGGWFISPALLQEYPNWRFADALSYIKYAFVAVSLNEDSSLLVTCLPSELNTAGQCVIPPINVGPYTGTAYNDYYGYDQYTIGFCAGILVVYIVVCRIISYLALRIIKI